MPDKLPEAISSPSRSVRQNLRWCAWPRKTRLRIRGPRKLSSGGKQKSSKNLSSGNFRSPLHLCRLERRSGMRFAYHIGDDSRFAIFLNADWDKATAISTAIFRVD